MSELHLPSISPTPPPLPRGTRRTGVVIALFAAGAVAWGLWSRSQAQAALEAAVNDSKLINVSTVAPQPVAGGDALVLPGTISAWSSAPIYARTSGYIKQWMVDIGTPVKAGQVLALIESPEVDQQLAQAEADMATDVANEKLAQVTAERWKALQKIDMVAKQDTDEKVSDAEAKHAAVVSAQANVDRLKQLQSFERVTAPFDGIVTNRNADIGTLVNAGNGGQELFHVDDTQKLRVYVQVPELYAGSIKTGDNADIRLANHADVHIPGQVNHTADAIDPDSRTLQVQLAVDNTEGKLLPGAYSEVSFKLKTAMQALRVPANTLLIRPEGTLLVAVDDNSRAALKPVVIGRDLGAQLEIVSGITASDHVVINPPDGIQNGDPLSVAVPAAPKH